MSEEVDYLYYDLSVTNRFSSSGASNTQLIFKDTRQSTILAHPEDYLLSVVRFQIDTTSLPVHRFEVVPNQADPDLGIYTVTMEYFSNANPSVPSQPEELLWSPVNLDIAVPPSPVANKNGYQTDSPYYYSYTFEHMLRLTNQALVRCLDKLKVLVLAQLGVNINTIDPPYLVWNVDRQSASLYAPLDHYNLDNTTHIKIYFNRPLYFLFNSFPVIEYSHNISLNRNYLIVMLPTKTADVGIDTYIVVDQEISTIANWSPLSSIVFTTGNIPVVSNLLSDPVIMEDNRQVPLSSGQDESLRIITDFVTDENCYRSNLLMYPTAEFRYIDMYNGGPLRTIDVVVFWRDKFGFLHPFYLDPGASCSMKLQFKRKFFSNHIV